MVLALDYGSRGAQSTIGLWIGHKQGSCFVVRVRLDGVLGCTGALREYGLGCEATESL